MTAMATEPDTVVIQRKTGGAETSGARQPDNGRAVRRLMPRDLDLVDCDVQAGRVSTVIFEDCGLLLEGIWSGVLSFDAWRRAGVRLEFQDAPGEQTSAFVELVAQAWRRYAAERRRRQLVAALILGLAAVVAVFVLVRR
jgi:hypothetical protein